ncbi:hypothetical protein ACIPRD_25980 [Streptomyces sp. NPDC090108]|uniref:hypothetical protein n=1 Tax=Streptomyces sp. NPDC090108 TaxID=3365947 RepID=UPI00380245E5
MSAVARVRGGRAVLALCFLLPLGAACGEVGERARGTGSSPAGRVLEGTDGTGRHLRETGAGQAPGAGIEVTPGATGGWDVVLTLRRFRFSAPGTRPEPAVGRGVARLFVDGRQVSLLRTRACHLAARLVPQGTHHLTVRLYADDGTAWAVHGKPVQSTADVTASAAETAPDPRR